MSYSESILPLSQSVLHCFASLAMTVFGLLLVERLFRNVSPDFRWSIKPLCLGLGGVFLFDLYLFSDALLFNRWTSTPSSIRGFAHALVCRWSRCRRFAVTTGTAAGHVVARGAAVGDAAGSLAPTCCSWSQQAITSLWRRMGRALQLALLFAALLVLVD